MTRMPALPLFPSARLLPGVLLVLLASAGGTARAQEPARIQPAALLAAPERHVGRALRLDGLACVDTGGAGFACTWENGERVLSLSAPGLGGRTKPPVAARLAGTCRGADNLRLRECRFSVVVRPVNAAKGIVNAGERRRPLVTLYAREIDLF